MSTPSLYNDVLKTKHDFQARKNSLSKYVSYSVKHAFLLKLNSDINLSKRILRRMLLAMILSEKNMSESEHAESCLYAESCLLDENIDYKNISMFIIHFILPIVFKDKNFMSQIKSDFGVVIYNYCCLLIKDEDESEADFSIRINILPKFLKNFYD
jgi:hypothetical protein